MALGFGGQETSVAIRNARHLRIEADAPSTGSTIEIMLKYKDQVRFTASEIEQCRRIGIDLAGVRTKADYSNAVIEFITTLERERPALLEKIYRALVARTGLTLPGKS